MTRRSWILPAMLGGACSPRPRDAATLLPASVDGAWQRTSLRDLPPPQVAVERAFEANYTGAGQIAVDLYETKQSGNAFEMTQRWRATPDSVFFDKGRYFAVVRWRDADRKALSGFVRAMQKSLGDLDK